MPSTLENAVANWIAAKLRELRGEGDNEVSYDKIAADLGITKPQIYSLVKHGRGAGPKVEQVFAEKFFNGSIDKLRKTAREWVATRNAIVHAGRPMRIAEAPSPPYIQRVVEESFRYPSLAQVLSDPANEKRWTEPARAAARSMQLKSDVDPGVEWWTRMLDGLEANIATLARMAGDPLAGLDEGPPQRSVRPAREKR